jgi:hypothetical protein
MNFSFTRVTSIDEIPFDDLFAGSLEKMDGGTYNWFGLDDEEAKRARIHDLAATIIALPDSFIQALTLDGMVVLAIFGAIRDETDLYNNITLARPNAAGSRSYIYDEAIRSAQHQFYIDHGIKRAFGFMPDGSTLKDGVVQRNQAWIDEETWERLGYQPTLRVFEQWRAE